MKPTDLDGRIKKLDERFYDYSFPHGTTTIDYSCFTAKEREIMERWWKIEEKYDRHVPIPVIEENKELMDALINVIWGRTFDAWGTLMEGVYCQNNLDKFIFWTRFYRFLDETSWIIRRGHLEQEKIEELFGDDPNWYSKDEDAIPDSDPRWKQLHEYLKKVEAEHEAKMEEKRKEEEKFLEGLIKDEETSEKQDK